MNADISDDICGYRGRISPKEDANVAYVDQAEWEESRMGKSICRRETWHDHEHCIWHTEVDDKPIDELVNAWSDGPKRLSGAYLSGVEFGGKISFAKCLLKEADISDSNLKSTDFTSANLQGANLSGADLTGADLSEAELANANLSGADLRGAELSGNLAGVDFSGAKLRGVDLSQANLQNSNLVNADLIDSKLSEANMESADMSGSVLWNANLSMSNLEHANLTGAALKSADLSKANLRYVQVVSVDLRETDLTGIQVNQRTKFTRQPQPKMTHLKPTEWDRVARAYHNLSTECSNDGLMGKARRLTIWEREARRKEAHTTQAYLTAAGSWLSWQATGYGISVKRVVRNMLLVLLSSALGYLLVGIETVNDAITINEISSLAIPSEVLFDSLYFSVITFTTVGYGTLGPHVGMARWIAMIEGMLGTILIVLLGYVLGNRESV